MKAGTEAITDLAIRAEQLLSSLALDLDNLANGGLPRNTSRAAIDVLRANANRCQNLAHTIRVEIDTPVPSGSFLVRLIEAAKPVAVATSIGLAVIGGVAEGTAASLAEQANSTASELTVVCTLAGDLEPLGPSRGVLVDGRLAILPSDAGIVVGSNPESQNEDDVLIPLEPASTAIAGSHLRLWIENGELWVTDLGAGRNTFLVRAGKALDQPVLLPLGRPTRLSSGDLLSVDGHTIETL